MKQEMTVEGGVLAGVNPKDECEMSAKRGAVVGVEAGIEWQTTAKRGVIEGVEQVTEWETTAKGQIMVEVGAGEDQKDRHQRSQLRYINLCEQPSQLQTSNFTAVLLKICKYWMSEISAASQTYVCTTKIVKFSAIQSLG